MRNLERLRISLSLPQSFRRGMKAPNVTLCTTNPTMAPVKALHEINLMRLRLWQEWASAVIGGSSSRPIFLIKGSIIRWLFMYRRRVCIGERLRRNFYDDTTCSSCFWIIAGYRNYSEWPRSVQRVSKISPFQSSYCFSYFFSFVARRLWTSRLVGYYPHRRASTVCKSHFAWGPELRFES